MNGVRFDQALSNFLDDDQCEASSEAVYQLIRTAFTAGWKAAKGSHLEAAEKELSSFAEDA